MNLGPIGTLEFEALLQIGLAILFGALIGLEREIRGRAAGLRTMIIVCLGSTLIMIVSGRLSEHYDGAAREIVRFDPGRVAAGIVTGVGFLGAGVVLKMGDLVRGVTTAACIWFIAGIGIAVGQRHYALAGAGTLACLMTLWILRFVDRFLPTRIYRTINVGAHTDNADSVHSRATAILGENKLRIMDVKTTRVVGAKEDELVFYVSGRQELQSHTLVATLAELQGVTRVKWS